MSSIILTVSQYLSFFFCLNVGNARYFMYGTLCKGVEALPLELQRCVTELREIERQNQGKHSKLSQWLERQLTLGLRKA